MDDKSTSSRASSDTCATYSTDWPGEWVTRLARFAKRYSHDHLCSGGHLDPLATYLSEPYTRSIASKAGDQDTQFAVLFDFASDDDIETFLPSPYELAWIKERNAIDVESTAQSQSQLLILQGHPSPEWINAIADTFSVDPEFFYHHLGRFFRKKTATSHTWPPLASQGLKEPCLRVITRGILNKEAVEGRQERYMCKLRQDVHELFGTYQDFVRADNGIDIGESLLRGISVHDASHFSYEQDMSIWTTQTRSGWFALAWLDIGVHNLGHGRYGKELRAPLGGNADNTIFGPVVFRRASQIDTNHLSPRTASLGDGDSNPIIPQNAMHLRRDYIETLDLSLARLDSFYAVSSIFAFSAASELQFLNMIKDVIHNDIREATIFRREDASLSNLLCNQLVLSEHISRLHANVSTIRARNSWPRLSCIPHDQREQIEQACATLLADFADLLQRAQDLANECERGIRKVEHLASQAESKRAIAQAKGVERLTRLAFVFVPMSFTASFFGMNFKQFGQGPLSIWVWFAVTVPIILVSLVLMVFRLRQKLTGCFTLWRRKKEGDIESGVVR
ncbi:hypothetical protein AC578_979 [Pseudocercospora eumusae]|uniref:Uncharacterized protein n=1 Tax=Pseudocercospora eumusae TaxID=321146 RepID=A0A139HEM1_9PEZI|nr:hypothetical protein AC578_979 [Pseudocercospora eumusae]